MYMYTYVHIYVLLYIGQPTRRSTYVPVITGSTSLEMRVMEQAAKTNSCYRVASGMIARVRTSTMLSVLS